MGGGLRLGQAWQVVQALEYLLVVCWGPAVKSRGRGGCFVLTLPASGTLRFQCYITLILTVFVGFSFNQVVFGEF